MQYNICTKSIEWREVIEAEMLVDQLEEVTQANVDYVRALLNYVYRVAAKWDIEYLAKAIKRLERRGLKESSLDLLEYSLESVLGKNQSQK